MIGMTLDQLKIFLAVAEHLHFSRAADTLYVTQPAVSAAIQNLEAKYGVKLFHRIGRHVEITDAGKLLQAEAQKILEQVALVERGLKELNDLQRGELHLGASFTTGNYWLPHKISRFKRQYPGISVNCTLKNADDICQGTACGLFDIGIIAGEVKSSMKKSLLEEVIGSDRLLIVVGKPHFWFNRDKISTEELLETPWIMRESGSGTQQIFELALQSWGISQADLKTILVLNSSEMIKSVVEAGLGAAAIPELMVTKELQLNTLRAIKVTHPDKSINSEIVRPVLKLKHRQRFQTRIAKAFEQILLEPVRTVGKRL